MWMKIWIKVWVFLKWAFKPVEEDIFCDCEDCIERQWWKAIA